MLSRWCGLCGLVLGVSLLAGCNNTLNPFCGSARPVPEIGSLSPSTLSFAQVQQGVTLTIKGSQFVASSQAVVDGKVLAATVTSGEQMKVTLTTGVIAAPGTIKVSVHTPSGGSADVGCSSGGDSTALMLTVN
jgi:IPT/TIG domain